MIHFASVEYLLLIFLIPFFFLFYALHRRERRKQMEKLGNMAMLERLMPYRSKAKGWVRITLFSIAWFFFAIGLSRPQIGARLKETNRQGAEIMIALDVSNSMLAEDYSPNRLERAKLAISRLVDKLHGDRIGLIVFAGQSFVQLPITTDYVSAKIFLNTIGTESVPVQGTALGEAIYTAMRSFSMEGQMGENNKAIILITDGENHEDDPVTAATAASQEGIRVFCIGVGSPEGKPIPMNGELLKDKEGNIVVTKLDEEILQEVAIAGNGAYVKAGNTEFGLNPILEKLEELQKEEFKSQVFEDFEEQYMYFFGIALFFFLLEFMIGNRRINRRLFTLLAFVLIGLSSANGQVDKREVRAGNRVFEKGNLKEADVEYRKARVKDSLSVAANYNLGNTQYRMDEYEEAEKFMTIAADSMAKAPLEVDWKRGMSSSPKGYKGADVYHNLGNIYLKQKKYAEAVEAYKNSLRRNPSDQDTRVNLAYAQKMLEDQQNQQNQQNQDQNQQNQDQNQDQDQQNDQNKDNQDNKENQENNDNKDNQNNQDNKNNQDKENQNNNQENEGQAPPKITPQAAEQMLQAMQEKENETQEKVKKEKAKALKSKQREKNW